MTGFFSISPSLFCFFLGVWCLCVLTVDAFSLFLSVLIYYFGLICVLLYVIISVTEVNMLTVAPASANNNNNAKNNSVTAALLIQLFNETRIEWHELEKIQNLPFRISASPVFPRRVRIVEVGPRDGLQNGKCL